MKHGRTWSEEEDVTDALDTDLSAQSTRGTETPVECVCRKRRRILWDEPAEGTQDPATAESQLVLELTQELMRTEAELQEQLHRNSYLEQKVENLEKNLTEQHQNILAQQRQLEQLALVKSEDKLKVEEQEASLAKSEEKLAEVQIISENLEHCLLKVKEEITVHVAQYQDKMKSMKDAHDAYAALSQKKMQELQEELSARDNLVQQLNQEKEASTEDQCKLKDIVEEHEHYAARLKSDIVTIEQKVSLRNHLIQQLQQEKQALEVSVIEIESYYVDQLEDAFDMYDELVMEREEGAQGADIPQELLERMMMGAGDGHWLR